MSSLTIMSCNLLTLLLLFFLPYFIGIFSAIECLHLPLTCLPDSRIWMDAVDKNWDKDKEI